MDNEELNRLLLEWAGYENVSPNSCQWTLRDQQGEIMEELFDDCFVDKGVGIAYCLDILWPLLAERFGIVKHSMRQYTEQGELYFACSLYQYSLGFYVEKAYQAADTPEIAFCKAAVQLIEEKGI